MLRLTRATTVVSHARRFTTSSVAARLTRSHESCTASSASLADPSMRYATPRRCSRCFSNSSAIQSRSFVTAPPSHVGRASCHEEDTAALEDVTASTTQGFMRTITAVSLKIVKIAAIVQLVLGIAFWTGHAYPLIPLHIVIGLALVLALSTISVLAFTARVRPPVAIFGLVWAVAMAAFGARQAMILIGPLHWMIRVIHLIMAIAAVRIGEMLAQGILAGTAGPTHRAEPEDEPAVRRAS